jgi:hypothetical protein
MIVEPDAMMNDQHRPYLKTIVSNIIRHHYNHQDRHQYHPIQRCRSYDHHRYLLQFTPNPEPHDSNLLQPKHTSMISMTSSITNIMHLGMITTQKLSTIDADASDDDDDDNDDTVHSTRRRQPKGEEACMIS